MKRAWFLSAGLCVACAEDVPENAYLTLSVLFAPSTGDAAFARIGFRRASDDAVTYDAVLTLSDQFSTRRAIAIEASGPALTTGALEVVLERCRDATCNMIDRVEHLQVPRAFYGGEQTRLEWTEGTLQASETPHEIDPCLVEGCGGYCDAQGRHVCEE